MENKQNRIIAIHQPNYFPWLGYFHKIFYCDVFIIHDNVQFSKRDFTKRTYIRKGPSSLEKTYLSVPLQKHSDYSIIQNILIDNSQNWHKKHLNKLKNTYQNSPFFNIYYPKIVELFEYCKKIKSLANLNVYIIKYVMKILSLKTKLFRSSLIPVKGYKSEYNINLIKYFQGTIYLSGSGAKGYQNRIDFNSVGIKLVYQNVFNFIEKYPYNQFQENFINGLSILDALFNIGGNKIIEIFKSNEKLLLE